jgi:hypothetical protein
MNSAGDKRRQFIDRFIRKPTDRYTAAGNKQISMVKDCRIEEDKSLHAATV